MKRRSLIALFAAAALASAGNASALTITADEADDICPPAADPCVISDTVVVSPPGSLLDFGLRAVEITGKGRIEQGAGLLCGSFLATSGGLVVDTAEGGSTAGAFSVTARRACSGDGTTPCLGSGNCVGLGTCSAGPPGTVNVNGELRGRGTPGGDFTIRAASDIFLEGAINVNGQNAGATGGSLTVDSYGGNVTMPAKVNAQAGPPSYDLSDDGGIVEIFAGGDITLGGSIEVGGGLGGGYFNALADGVISIDDDIKTGGGGLPSATGGSVVVDGYGGIRIGTSGNTMRVQTNGNQARDYGGYYVYVGYGGFQYFSSFGDITLAQNAALETRSGNFSCSGSPNGGEVYLFGQAPGTRITLDGDVFAEGRGACSYGGIIVSENEGELVIGPKSTVSVASRYGGVLQMELNGDSAIHGVIDTRGTPAGYQYYSGGYGVGGYLYLDGDADVAMSGSLLSGSGGGSATAIVMDVCRLTMESSAKIDHTAGSNAGPDAENDVGVELTIRESMLAKAGSKIRSDAAGDATNEIVYRDANKPPVLLGEVDPPALLDLAPGLSGCPVCGNAEIDKTESCDDGNTTSGDGCRDDCQDEGCLAQSPGYPGTPICDDADACTVDTCDPVAHSCNNVLNCEEGVSCTVDLCSAGACQHTPDDSLCDDGNDCTDDICNATTDCQYANLTGNGCEDGDVCTVTGSCNVGVCESTDIRKAVKSKIVVRFKPGPADDKMKLTTRLPLADYFVNTDPAATGVVFTLFDAARNTAYTATVPAAAWVARGSGKYTYKPDAALPEAAGIGAAKVVISTARQEAKFTLKTEGVDIPGAQGQAAMSASMLFGADPAVDDCLTTRSDTTIGVPCRTKATKTVCKE